MLDYPVVHFIPHEPTPQGFLQFRQPKSLEYYEQKQSFILHERKEVDIMGVSMEKTQICKSEISHPKTCACLLKCEFCHLLSNVSFLILTSTGSLILAFLASLSMERAPNKRLRFLCYEAFNQPVHDRSVTVVKMHGTCKPTRGLDIMEETPEQPHRKYQLRDSGGDRLAGQYFYSMVHIFFMISQDLINSMPHPKSIHYLEVVALCLLFVDV